MPGPLDSHLNKTVRCTDPDDPTREVQGTLVKVDYAALTAHIDLDGSPAPPRKKKARKKAKREAKREAKPKKAAKPTPAPVPREVPLQSVRMVKE